MIKKLKKHKLLCGIVLLLFLIVLVVAILLITKKNNSNSSTDRRQQSTIRLAKMDLTKSVSATGTIASKKTKTVSANVNGLTVKSVAVSIGDSVTKGDTLATFDKSDLQDTLADAKENLADTQSEVSHSIASAKKQLADAKDTYADSKSEAAKKVTEAKQDWQAAKKTVSQLKKQIAKAGNANQKKQLQENLTAAQEKLQQAKASYETAVSNRDSTNKQNKSSVSNAEESVYNAESSGKKSIKEAQKQVTEARSTLEKCAVTAPISGVITAVNVEAGDVYSSGTMFQIDDTSAFTVTTTVDEYDISNVSVGQRVVILTEATDSDELEGKITFVAPSTSSTSSQSADNAAGGSGVSASSSGDGYEVTIALTSDDDRLKMGLTAKCSIILEEADDVFAVPYDAIHKNSSGEDVIYVTQSNSGTQTDASDRQADTSADYQEIPVTKGMESDYYVEITGDSLSEGMSVIIPTDETSSSSDSEEKTNSFLPGSEGKMNKNGGMPAGGGMPNGNGGGNRPSGNGAAGR